MVNYSNGKIYKLVSDKTNKIYIGSTTQPLSKRIVTHRSHYKVNCSGTACEIIKFGDPKIILIEAYPAKSKEDLLSREDYWYQKFKDICVNKNQAFGRDPNKKNSKWHIKNHDYLIKIQKKYNQKKWNCPYCMEFGITFDRHKNRHLNSKFHLETKKIIDKALATSNSLKI
jgi:GIY-YIG catalytic domain